jgi:hypothetical protein
MADTGSQWKEQSGVCLTREPSQPTAPFYPGFPRKVLLLMVPNHHVPWPKDELDHHKDSAKSRAKKRKLVKFELERPFGVEVIRDPVRPSRP